MRPLQEREIVEMCHAAGYPSGNLQRDAMSGMQHHEIRKYYQSTSTAHVTVLQNLAACRSICYESSRDYIATSHETAHLGSAASCSNTFFVTTLSLLQAHAGRYLRGSAGKAARRDVLCCSRAWYREPSRAPRRSRDPMSSSSPTWLVSR